MKRYIAVLEIDDDEEIVGSIDATVSYTYRRNGTNYAISESVEFEAEDCEEPHLDEWAEHCHKITDNDCDKPSGEWIPLICREPTEEEKAEYLEQHGEKLCYMLDNKMPLHGEDVLVSVGGNVYEDIFDEDFYNFENVDIENVDAWMPKPKPYKENKEGRE